MHEIQSIWTKITADWSEERGFYNRKEVFAKTLGIEFIECGGKLIIQFIRGPTGFEVYYVEDLKRHADKLDYDEDFCICAGTTNSWPRCTVKWGSLWNIIKTA